MKHTTHQKLARRKRRIEKRLARRRWKDQPRPILKARNIQYEVADRGRAVTCGGLGAIHLLVQHVGLPEAIDRNIDVLKVHLPYHESDHVLALAYNILAGGTCIEDLEHLRTDEAILDGLGAQRLPDPTTAGDFCRRFTSDAQVLLLQETFNESRLKVWKQQPPEFFAQAVVDADGTIAPTYGECKQGMDISYNNQWSYHPLLISLANTKEPLYLVNRGGNRPSHEQADEYLDKAIVLCERAGFQRILLRGDTDFTQTWKLDGWDARGNVTFIFGADDTRGRRALAEALPATAWRRLKRPAKYEVKTQERTKPENVKERIVRERGYTNFVLLWEEYRHFFHITNDRASTAEAVVFSANDRCDQENLIEQLKNGVKAMRNPLDTLHSNWAYMVMSSLAWSLKAWCGLLLPVTPGWDWRHEQEKRSLVQMEFKRFLASMIRLPAQIVRTGRRIIYRLMGWNPWVSCLLRLAEAMHRPLRC